MTNRPPELAPLRAAQMKKVEEAHGRLLRAHDQVAAAELNLKLAVHAAANAGVRKPELAQMVGVKRASVYRWIREVNATSE